MPQPQQCQIRAASATYTIVHGNARSFNPLSEAKDWTCILMDTNWVLNLLCRNCNSHIPFPISIFLGFSWEIHKSLETKKTLYICILRWWLIQRWNEAASFQLKDWRMGVVWQDLVLAVGCYLFRTQFSSCWIPIRINWLSLEKYQTQIEIVYGKTQLSAVPFQRRLCISQESCLTFQENHSFSNCVFMGYLGQLNFK